MGILERITVAGYKSIKELKDFELRQINVLIGANGAGKSNLLSLFKLLDSLVSERLQLFVGKNGRADALLYFGRKVTSELLISLDLKEKVSLETYGYDIRLTPTIEGWLIFAQEDVMYRSTQGIRARAMELGSGHPETQLRRIDPQLDRWTPMVYQCLKGWKTYHFQDTTENAKVKQLGSIYENNYLNADADNLAAYLYLLQTSYPNHYRRIVETIRLAAPFFDDFLLRPDRLSPQRIRIEWLHRKAKDSFDVSQLSDGTLRFICLTTLLLQPDPPSLIIIDEPELGLHPSAITLLAAMLQSASVKSQIIVSTQSVELVNEFQPEDIVVADYDNAQSTFRRLKTEELSGWLEDYKLGELWTTNLFGGRP